MKRVVYTAVSSLFSLACVAVAAQTVPAERPVGASQRPVVTARLSADSIGIGDTLSLIIEVERDQVQVVNFPELQDDDHIEVVASLPVDTLGREGRKLRLRKRYKLQPFDEGRYNLGRPGVLYADKNIVDTLYTPDSLIVQVGTFLIDTTRQDIRDIRPQRSLPFRFAEISGYLVRALLIAALLAVAIVLLVRYLAGRGRRITDLFRPAPPQPPHVVAIRALEELHHQKLWQNNRHKQYYSGITEILRRYLDGRYGIGALEMTSDEILEALKPLDLPRKCIMDLTAILREADLVKFAKAAPDGNENEDNYLKAYYFVEETKPVENPPVGEDEEERPVEESRK